MITEFQQTQRLSHSDQQKSDSKRLMPIVKEALMQSVWLYNKYSGRWYTPEEFQSIYQNKEMTEFEVRSLLENMVIRDPKGGNAAYHKAIDQKIEQYKKEIAELKIKGETFLNKVIEYYQQKLPRR